MSSRYLPSNLATANMRAMEAVNNSPTKQEKVGPGSASRSKTECLSAFDAERAPNLEAASNVHDPAGGIR